MTSVELDFICDVCGHPVEDGHGSLYLRFAQLNETRNARADWEATNPPGQALSLSSILMSPGLAPWLIHHDACRPNEADGYHIDVERVRSWRDLVRWTAHLMDKNWLPDTDWRVLLGNAAYARDRRIVELTRGDAA